ncbi:hypothetical protein GA830_12715 [Mesorhizobium sp. NBSH29]|uniref:hypothetical protein n=1 Tax=Mesorhizobium sp. NBSH29 TaxID=2654249 RepID=UPI0018968F53|nr:hypothetical protein [Mesorhizobium sp. NBSH29]QPC87511.1 hypothetical protein GA830_12715 [Mesorhizobium sp. NBSH29]
MREIRWTSDIIEKQRQLRPGDRNYSNEWVMIRAYALHLNDQGVRPTYARIREMLDSLGRGYTGQPCQIFEALRRLYMHGLLDQYPNGRRVRVGDRLYRSIRAAAKGEHCRQSAVAERIAKGEPGWSFID